MKITRQQILEGEILPPFYYGYSYRDFGRFIDYYHVIPLNYIIRFFIHLKYFWNRFRSRPSRLDIQIEEGIREKLIIEKDIKLLLNLKGDTM